ncbi:MAG: amino acid ABC transporter substrate-binding protein [Desulfobacula sp.]|nr:amino acid ABC transporter substrate-binding protein [Desulfobacula sp.]
MKSFILFILSMLIASPIYADSLQVVTEEFPPFNYTEDGKITGCSTEVIEAVFKEACILCKPISYPWARAYKMALRDKNVIIYSMVRNGEREKLFKWVGPISSSRGYIYKLKSRTGIKINKIEDAGQYKLGLVREFAITQKLLAKPEFIKGKNVFLVSREEQLIKMLKYGHIELMVMAEPTLIHRSKQMGEDISMFDKAYLMDETYGYIGVNKQTPDKTVNRLQSALDKLKDNGTYKRILLKYFPE